MIEMEGRLLNLGKADLCGRRFAEDCRISFPKKIPITINFSRDPDQVIGYGEISKNDKGLKVIAKLFRDEFNDPEYNVGGYYINVKSHDESSVKIIDECKLVSMSLVAAPADETLKIKKIQK